MLHSPGHAVEHSYLKENEATLYREVTSYKDNKIEERCNKSNGIRFDEKYLMRLLYLRRRSCGATHRAAGHVPGCVTEQSIAEGLWAITKRSQCRLGEADD